MMGLAPVYRPEKEGCMTVGKSQSRLVRVWRHGCLITGIQDSFCHPRPRKLEQSRGCIRIARLLFNGCVCTLLIKRLEYMRMKAIIKKCRYAAEVPIGTYSVFPRGGQSVFANEFNQHGDVISNDRRCVHDLAKSPS